MHHGIGVQCVGLTHFPGDEYLSGRAIIISVSDRTAFGSVFRLKNALAMKSRSRTRKYVPSFGAVSIGSQALIPNTSPISKPS